MNNKARSIDRTGGSKVMHLLNPKLFLIWDTAMRKHYGYSGGSDEDYLRYHKLVQKKVQDIKWDSSAKALPKAIDEYHYITITRKLKLR